MHEMLHLSCLDSTQNQKFPFLPGLAAEWQMSTAHLQSHCHTIETERELSASHTPAPVPVVQVLHAHVQVIQIWRAAVERCFALPPNESNTTALLEFCFPLSCVTNLQESGPTRYLSTGTNHNHERNLYPALNSQLNLQLSFPSLVVHQPFANRLRFRLSLTSLPSLTSPSSHHPSVPHSTRHFRVVIAWCCTGSRNSSDPFLCGNGGLAI